MSQEKTTIVYAFDPLCGWCYGVSKLVKLMLDNYSDSINLEIRLVGLFILEAAKPYKEFKRHINTAQVRLKEVTGTTLDQSFLDNILDSETIANSSTPNQFLLDLKKTGLSKREFFDVTMEMQRLHYDKGMDFNQRDLYLTALKNSSVANFHFTLNTDPMDTSMELMEEYRLTRDLGGYGFPAFFIKKSTNYKHLPHSYEKEEFLKMIEELVPN